jgi:RNA polymerase sigma factor (TIGR02999 family)
MSDVTRILEQIDSGDPSAAEQLLPLVYDELRKLAAARMAQESPDHTLQATALVHEAWLRLVNTEQPRRWESRRHFFAAAAEAMRRILIESARRKRRLKRGGNRERIDLHEPAALAPEMPEVLLDLDAALSRFAALEPDKAEVVRLRYFAGLTLTEIADVLGCSEVTIKRHWRYARAWLHKELNGTEGSVPGTDSAEKT